MQNKKKGLFIFFVGILISLFFIFFHSLNSNPTVIPSTLIGRPLPDVQLSLLSDPSEVCDFKSVKKKMTIITVWASWCENCLVEQPFLMALKKENKVQILGLNYQDNYPDARDFLNQWGDPFLFSAYDEKGWVSEKWGVYGAPETFLLDRKGIVRYRHIGPLNKEVWKKQFMPLIKQYEHIS